MDPFMGPTTGIVPLTNVVQLLDLVPVFNTVLPGIAPSSKTCYGELHTLLSEYVR